MFSVDILLNATGNVPIMKTRKWAVDQEKPISWIIKFIHKYLKLDPEEKLVRLLLLFRTTKTNTTTNIQLSSYVFIVSLCQPNVCAIARSNNQKSLRLLWNKWEIDFVLLQKPSMGLICATKKLLHFF